MALFRLACNRLTVGGKEPDSDNFGLDQRIYPDGGPLPLFSYY